MAAPKGNKFHKKRKTIGRKTLYRAEYDLQAYNMSLLGLTDIEMAEALGVTETTINKWKKDHKAFALSIKRGKLIADGQVANNLYKRANGYAYDEVHFEKVDIKESLQDSENEEIKIDAFKKKVITKEVAPDVTAQIFWLKNRQPQLWRDKQSTELTGKDGKDLIPARILTKKEAQELFKSLEDEC